jgi:Mn-dependent DtxR family transcriptional regulator
MASMPVEFPSQMALMKSIQRVLADALPITQSLLAEMLGVQRPTITNAARELEHVGLIERGLRQVTILDRQGLTEESCECYQLVSERASLFTFPKHTHN